MHRCPHCGENTIKTWKKYWSTPRRPIKCRSCGEESYQSVKYSKYIVASEIIIFLLGWWLLFPSMEFFLLIAVLILAPLVTETITAFRAPLVIVKGK